MDSHLVWLLTAFLKVRLVFLAAGEDRHCNELGELIEPRDHRLPKRRTHLIDFHVHELVLKILHDLLSDAGKLFILLHLSTERLILEYLVRHLVLRSESWLERLVLHIHWHSEVGVGCVRGWLDDAKTRPLIELLRPELSCLVKFESI